MSGKKYILPIRRKITVGDRKANIQIGVRQFRAYSIGLPRSGTHSIAYMFSTNYLAHHEPEAEKFIMQILRYKNGEYSRENMLELLRKHDELLQLELESSHYMHHITDILISAFPDAKFILTMRNPYKWINSEINQNIYTQNLPVWRKLEKYRYSRYNSSYYDEEKILKKIKNVYPIRSYLLYWRDHYRKVIKNIPKDQLLILKTREINRSSKKLSRFLSIPEDSIDLSYSHSGKKKRLFDLYSHVPLDFVRKNIEDYCGDIVNSLYPDLFKSDSSV